SGYGGGDSDAACKQRRTQIRRAHEETSTRGGIDAYMNIEAGLIRVVKSSRASHPDRVWPRILATGKPPPCTRGGWGGSLLTRSRKNPLIPPEYRGDAAKACE